MNQLVIRVILLLSIGLSTGLSAQKSSSLPNKLNSSAIISDYSSLDNQSPINAGALRHTAKQNTSTYGNGKLTNIGFQLKSSFGKSKSLILKHLKDGEKTVWLEVSPSKTLKSKSDISDAVFQLLDEHGSKFGIQNAVDQSLITSVHQDDLGETHVKIQQLHKGIPVIGGELIVHTVDEVPYLISGSTEYIRSNFKITPSISEEEAVSNIRTEKGLLDISEDLLKYIGHQQFEIELVVYPYNEKAHLAYRIVAFPNITEQWTYYLDAHSGEVINEYRSSCKFHNDEHQHYLDEDYRKSESKLLGPENASATNLAGSTVGLNVYEESGIYFLLNVSENMFNVSQSQLPNEPVGGILTLNANNTAPQNSNFAVDHITSNNNTWSNPIGVTAHVNATSSYDYFEQVLGRNSYDNNGSTIYSFTNVADMDGTAMDNAFWNGYAMYYGNGNQAFVRPLAAALDVAAHELTHGVIQYTANLSYQNESGALNESFADIFAVLIENETYQIGEDVVNTNIFQSGALRSLSDPHNGGTKLGDAGWQPNHVNEQFRGNEDNGGVHINSGIPNHAFFLLSNNPDVGPTNAGAIFFKALRDYLTSSSDFKALRRAVGQSIVDQFGQDQAILTAYNSAFDQVGIAATGSTEPIPDPVQEFESNPGEDYVVWYKEDESSINIERQSDGMNFTISTLGMINSPSVSDDGRLILFIGNDRNMHAIRIDWDNGGTTEELLVDNSRDWRNVAISKDGNRIAALSGNLSANQFDNRMLIIDLASQTEKWFELYNPTFAQDVQTQDVLYADALEWDHTSQFVMYDAFNQIPSFLNESITYWDIGFIEVWDNTSNSFMDGNIQKLFSSLPENVSVANPTFSKISPDRIALDVIDRRGEELDLFLLGVNLETGNQGLIFENLNTLGYPDYSSTDDRVLFNFLQNNQPAIAFQNMAEDAITGTGDAFLFIEDAVWGTWLSNGTRDLTTATKDLIKDPTAFTIFPNPADQSVQIESDKINCQPCQLEIYNSNGQRSISTTFRNSDEIEIQDLNPGMYLLKIIDDDNVYIQSLIKSRQ